MKEGVSAIVKGQRAADRIEHLKKGDMATEAETLLADTGWLPEPLRTPARTDTESGEVPAPEPVVREAAEIDAETAMGEEDGVEGTSEADGAPRTAAAE